MRVPQRQLAKQAHGSEGTQGWSHPRGSDQDPRGRGKAEVTVWGREKGELKSLGENHLARGLC